MRVTLYGAAGDVTGSAYHVQTDHAAVLVDCGMFQGGKEADEKNRVPPPIDLGRLDAVLVTHGHLDHTGRLPLLIRNGFAGPLHATAATIDMTALILRDSAKVQATDLVRTNRKRERAGKPHLEPLYGAADVERTVQSCQPMPYDQAFPVAPGISARAVEAGHMLGSVSLELSIEEAGRQRLVVFSGDLGPRGLPVLRDAVPLPRADLVFLESTYGDRDHRLLSETLAEGRRIIQEAVQRKGKILVPAFAVGRTQQILYHLAALFRDGSVPPFPVFVDSPMAIEASKIYARHPELYDEEAAALFRTHQLDVDLRSVKPTATADESKAINEVPGPCLILAGAGMCNAGRILHHLRHNLWRPDTAVIIVGYQAEGTLGRLLVEGAKEVSIFGEKIAVRAQVHTLGGLSAHAGQTDLLRWFDVMAGSRPRVVLSHGEARGREPLAKLIQERYDLEPVLPMLGDSVEP